jgi:hypothetical protein
MRWLQKNQGHLIVVERARLENQSKRFRLPRKTVIFTFILAAWGCIWLVSVVIYSFHSWRLVGRQHEEDHDHKTLMQNSPVLRSLRRPLHGSCFFRATEKPKYGFISSECTRKRTCPFRQTLTEAKDACLLSETCFGVTFVPWEERYELRDFGTIKESYDGQVSYLKRCEDGQKKEIPVLADDGLSGRVDVNVPPLGEASVNGGRVLKNTQTEEDTDRTSASLDADNKQDEDGEQDDDGEQDEDGDDKDEEEEPEEDDDPNEDEDDNDDEGIPGNARGDSAQDDTPKNVGKSGEVEDV